MVRARTLVTMLLAALLGGCAAASGQIGAGANAGRGLHGGIYVPFDNEVAHDCRQLGFLIEKGVSRLTALVKDAEQQKSGPPASVARAFNRLAGAGIPAIEDYDYERARIVAFNGLLAEKGCKRVDVDAQTAASDARMAQLRGRY